MLISRPAGFSLTQVFYDVSKCKAYVSVTYPSVAVSKDRLLGWQELIFYNREIFSW